MEESCDEDCSPASPDSPDSPGVVSDVDLTATAARQLVMSGDVELGAIVLDTNQAWDDEEEKVASFVAGGCSCRLGPGNSPCHKLFSASEYSEIRDECRELSREELDLVIMGELRALTVRDSTTFRSSDRVRTSSRFEVGGHRVCIKTFCFMHTVGRGKLTAIKNSWLEHGLRPRRKVSFTPHNTTSLADVELVVRFILHYAEDNAILLPGRVPGYKRDDLQLLPSAVTKREVWELYHRAASSSDGSRAVCYSLFCRLWKQLTPQVVVSKPMTDLCWTCQKNSTLIMRSHNRPVEEKTEVHVCACI